MKHSTHPNQLVISADDGTPQLIIDKEAYTVIVNSSQMHFTRKEFELLYLMASHPGKVFRRKEIAEKVWNRNFIESERTIDTHIRKLRRKLGKEFIQTQVGIGYRFRK